MDWRGIDGRGGDGINGEWRKKEENRLARLNGVQEVGGSNPLAPTKYNN